MYPQRETVIIRLFGIPPSKSSSYLGQPEVTLHFRSVEGVTYKCSGPGALLSIPHDGKSRDIILAKVFEEYVQNNVVSWFEWSQKNRLDVSHMEDLILITGCTLVASWAAVTFFGRSESVEISLVKMSDQSDRNFQCNFVQGDGEQHSSRFDPVRYPCHV